MEHDYGVPGPVIMAFWALETDYGAFMGDTSLFTSLATLAYDCRRPDLFRAELMNALQIVDHGDIAAAQLKGSWAGAFGHVQFTPSTYMTFAVDQDGDGRRDIVGSVPDALGSAGKYIQSLGWRAGEPWLEEVRVADTVPWQEAARDHLSPARLLVEVRRAPRRRQRAARRRSARRAHPAHGPARPGLPRLQEFPGVLGVEQQLQLHPRRRLSRHADRRRAAPGPRQRPAHPRLTTRCASCRSG